MRWIQAEQVREYFGQLCHAWDISRGIKRNISIVLGQLGSMGRNK